MKLIANNYYYIFLGLSLILALLIAIFYLPEVTVKNLGFSCDEFQSKVRGYFFTVYPIHAIMFCYWLMTEYNALSSLRIRRRFSGIMAWSTFIPLLNLYFPQAMVQELEDRLYYVQVRRINIRFVPIWWFFQCIAYLWELGQVFGMADYLMNHAYWLIIVLDLCVAVALVCQGYLLYGFMLAITTVGNNRRRAHSDRGSRSSASARRIRHRQ